MNLSSHGSNETILQSLRASATQRQDKIQGSLRSSIKQRDILRQYFITNFLLIASIYLALLCPNAVIVPVMYYIL